MKIAIYGGSFNPIHIGHLAVAESAAVEYGYDKILFVPTFIPPHKQLSASVSPASRLAMLESAIGTNSRFQIEPCEIQRGGISYTIDTVKFLTKKYGDRLEGKLGLIIGQEIAAEFGKWREADTVASLCDILIVSRRNLGENRVTEATNKPRGDYIGGVDAHGQFMGVTSDTFKWPYKEVHNMIVPISSTDIRFRISQGKDWRYFVTPSVYEYIVSNRLYGYKQ